MNLRCRLVRLSVFGPPEHTTNFVFVCISVHIYTYTYINIYIYTHGFLMTVVQNASGLLLYVFYVLFQCYVLLAPDFVGLHKTRWNFDFRAVLFCRGFVARLHVHLKGCFGGLGKMFACVHTCALYLKGRGVWARCWREGVLGGDEEEGVVKTVTVLEFRIECPTKRSLSQVNRKPDGIYIYI